MSGIAWYGFWLVIVLALYWPVLPALPFRDQPHLMLNHQLAENDWQWFWSMLSYNRTRILTPGDYILFRPVHMVVIALQDIFLRYHIVAQGVVNCMLFAFAATVFSSLTKRFVGVVASLALTLLWVSQMAGSAMVFWQHIAPYILCPAFFLLALRMFDADDLGWSQRAKNCGAALCVLVATLSNEIGVATALSVSFLALLCRRDGVRSRQLLFVFGLPVSSALLINLIDYFIIHPHPLLLSTAVDIPSHELTVTLLIKFFGAIGAALLASPALHPDQLVDGFIQWKFYNEAPALLYAMAALVAALLLTAAVVVGRELRQNGMSRRALALVLLLSFFLAVLAVCAFRMHFRGSVYMASASYYYALFALALCGIAADLLANTKKSVKTGLVIMLAVAIAFNIAALRAYFAKMEQQITAFQSVVTEGRKILAAAPGLCFGGVIPVASFYGSMFYDVSCAHRPGATPIYINTDPTGIWLSSVLYTGITSTMTQMQLLPSLRLPSNGGWVTSLTIPYGHDVQFTVNKADNFTVSISDQYNSQRSMTIERNLLSVFFQDKGWARLEAALDRDSAALAINYKVGFTMERIVLFADGRLIGDVPALPQETAYANLVLRSTGGKPAEFTNLSISERPSQGKLEIKPLYSLMKK